MEGKVAIVTGSSRGIGRAIMEMLLEKGFKVYISVIANALSRHCILNVRVWGLGHFHMDFKHTQ